MQQININQIFEMIIDTNNSLIKAQLSINMLKDVIISLMQERNELKSEINKLKGQANESSQSN